MLEAIVALINFLSTWRLSLVLVEAVIGYFVVVEWTPVGVPRVIGLVFTIVMSCCLGGFWQTRHERTLGQKTKQDA